MQRDEQSDMPCPASRGPTCSSSSGSICRMEGAESSDSDAELRARLRKRKRKPRSHCRLTRSKCCSETDGSAASDGSSGGGSVGGGSGSGGSGSHWNQRDGRGGGGGRYKEHEPPAQPSGSGAGSSGLNGQDAARPSRIAGWARPVHPATSHETLPSLVAGWAQHLEPEIKKLKNMFTPSSPLRVHTGCSGIGGPTAALEAGVHTTEVTESSEQQPTQASSVTDTGRDQQPE